MEYTKLASYNSKKGKFISPWNEYMNPVNDNAEIECLAPLTVVIKGEIDSMVVLKLSNRMLIEESRTKN